MYTRRLARAYLRERAARILEGCFIRVILLELAALVILWLTR